MRWGSIGGRRASTRQGTTPSRQKENTAVAEFGKLFAKEQAKEDEKRNLLSANAANDAPRVEPEAVATECLLYGYANKASEWKVLSKFERIVAPSIICEDYPRDDPNLYLSSNSPMGISRSSVVIHKNLTKDALKKSKVYKGGQHWIKITFDSYQAAERACFYSPIEVDGYLVHCEMWQGRGPTSDTAIPKGSEAANMLLSNKSRTLGTAAGKDSAVAGFERAMTLPRSHTMPDVQYGQPSATQDDTSVSSATASSATALEASSPGALAPDAPSGLRSRSTPSLPSQVAQAPASQYMKHIPTVRKAVLRPLSEALPPQPSFFERAVRSIPVVSWVFGLSGKGTPGETISEGPVIKDDGTWDENTNGWYWSFWHGVDYWLGTDFCGLKDD